MLNRCSLVSVACSVPARHQTDCCSVPSPPKTLCPVQVETFEVVKVNLYNTLGALATVMDEAQLDLLFKKFEGSRSRPLSDTLRLFSLLQRLVVSDSRVRPHCPILTAC